MLLHSARPGWSFDEPAPNARRHLPVIGGVLVAHLAAGWALMRVDAMRAAVAESAPLFVEWIAAQPVPPPVPAPPPPPPAPKKIASPPKPAPLHVAAPAPAPAKFEAPPPPVEPPTPPAPPAPAFETAPPAPPAAAPQPKTVAASAVRYLEAPAPVYPAASRRRGEAGRVVVRVLIDTQGLPAQSAVQQSSGFARLDESALAAIRAARFKPYTEDGVAHAAWALIPIAFDLE